MHSSTTTTFTAGADAGALLAAAHQMELASAMGSADASHLGAHLAGRTPALPVRMARTAHAALAAGRLEWRRREPLVTVRRAGASPQPA